MIFVVLFIRIVRDLKGQNNGQKEEIKMSRRGENIRKRTDGRWEARFSVTDPVTGKRKSRSVYAKTYSDVKKRLIEEKYVLEREIQKDRREKEPPCVKYSFGSASKENILLTEIAMAWLTEILKTKKHSTYVKYRSIYDSHIAASFNGISIMDLSKNEAADQQESIFFSKENLSDSVIKSIYCVLNQIFEYCNRRFHTNIRPAVRPKTHTVLKPIKTLAQSEQVSLLQEIYRDMDTIKFGILLCLSTGLRLGEICSLKWSDIDLNGKLLYVNRTVQRIAVDGQSTKTVLREDTPKSMFSKREIPLPDNIMPYLFSFRQPDGYVISGNGPTEPRTYQYRFQRLLSDAGIGKHNFHVLRHTFATNCINSGSDIKSLSEILGHSSVNITLNRYVHPTIDTKRRHLNNLSLVYGQYAEPKCS